MVPSRGADSHPPASPSSVVDLNLDQLDGKLHHGVDLVGYRLTGQARLVHDLSSYNPGAFIDTALY